jgi:hypothetical protein
MYILIYNFLGRIGCLPQKHLFLNNKWRMDPMVKRNLKQFQVYFRPRQIESLNKLQSRVEKEHDVSFPVSEFIRDAVDQFLLETADENALKNYLEIKGW